MRQRFALLGTLLAVCLILSGGCGSNSNSSTTPVISSMSPSTKPAGEGGFILSVSGTNMNGSSVVHFGTDNLTPAQVLNPPCPTGMNCITTLEVGVPPVDVVNAGTVQVSVTTASQNSANVNFTVASPQILTISPMAVAAGGASFPLTVTVLNAAPNVQINFGAMTPLVPTGPVSCNRHVDHCEPKGDERRHGNSQFPGCRLRPIPDRAIRERRNAGKRREHAFFGFRRRAFCGV